METNLHLLRTSRARNPPPQPGVVVNEPVHVADGVELVDSEIGPNVTISAGSRVVRSRLRDVIVGSGSRIETCDLHDSLIGDEVTVRNVRGRVDLGNHSVVDAQGSGERRDERD